jgi:hypothetical protein
MTEQARKLAYATYALERVQQRLTTEHNEFERVRIEQNLQYWTDAVRRAKQ